MNGNIVIAIDRLVFAFLLVPFIFVGLTSGLFELVVLMIAAAIVRIFIQFVIKDKVTVSGRTMPFLNLNIRSYEIILFSFGVSLALAMGEGELTMFLKIGFIVLVLYLISSFFLFKYDIPDSEFEYQY